MKIKDLKSQNFPKIKYLKGQNFPKIKYLIFALLFSFKLLYHLDKFLAVGRKRHFAGCFAFICVPDLFGEMSGKVCALKMNSVNGEYRVPQKAEVCFAQSWKNFFNILAVIVVRVAVDCHGVKVRVTPCAADSENFGVFFPGYVVVDIAAKAYVPAGGIFRSCFLIISFTT